jgi:hypothetical protein
MVLGDAFKADFELEDGLPRQWGKGDEEEVKRLFKKSALEAEKLLDLYAFIRLVQSFNSWLTSFRMKVSLRTSSSIRKATRLHRSAKRLLTRAMMA